MEILIISGLSGGGKSKAASFLEDIGYYTVDNLPAEMMMKFAGFCAASSGRYDRVALVYDVRSGEPTDMLIDTLEQLKASGVNCRMLFLEADTPTIINRYKETRRMHPLQAKGLSVEEAVRRERALMQPVRDHADFVLDTSSLSTAKLRSELLNLFGTPSDRGGLNVSVLSFGFKHGIPIESDLVFDVRFMPNPYYVAELKNKTGLDREVRDFVFSFRQTHEFMARLEKMIAFLLPLYSEEGKTVLVIGIGCTGGHHRSVAVTHAPGLIGALLVGVNFAKGLSMAAGLPLIPVHHLRSHIAANYLAHPELKPPFLCLVVSGGHSHIVEVADYTKMRIIGRTRDDAAGATDGQEQDTPTELEILPLEGAQLPPAAAGTHGEQIEHPVVPRLLCQSIQQFLNLHGGGNVLCSAAC